VHGRVQATIDLFTERYKGMKVDVIAGNDRR
jgi:hypothetical protein